MKIDPKRMTVSLMKYVAHAARCSLAALLLCALGVSTAYAQDNAQCEIYDVRVDMWNLPQTTNSNLPLGNLRTQFLDITNAILDHINNFENIENTPLVSRFDPTSSTALLDDLNIIKSAYCVRRGRLDPQRSDIRRAYPYTALVRPILEEPYTYEIRGLHLLARDSESEDRPQLIIRFKIESKVAGQHPLEQPDVILTGLEVFNFQDYPERDLDSTSPRVEQVRALIEQFGNAYNAGTLAGIEDQLDVVLDDDLLAPDDVEIFESSNRKNSRGVYEQRIGNSKNAETYLSSIARRLDRYGKTEVTFDVIDVYRIPSTDLGEEVYRATVLQHYMYEKALQSSVSETYMDSDYLAIDVVFNAEAKPVIRLRKAGRATFALDSDPSGVDITAVNGRDLSAHNIKTPLDYLLNVPLQYHQIQLENVWYEPQTVTIDPPSRKPEHLNGSNTTVTMVHREANLVLNVDPPSRANDLVYDIGNGEQALEPGTTTIPLNAPELQGDPPPGGTITTNDRWVDLKVTVPALENVEAMSDTVNWNRPKTRIVDIQFPRGILEVSSTPDQSTATVVGLNGSTQNGTTLASFEVEATLPADTMALSVSNDQCFQDDPEVDECRYHIPSEVRSDFRITPGATTREHFDLTPFLVKDETRAGDISNVRLTRDDMLLTVAYTVEDNKDRDRNFILDFDMFDSNTNEKLADLDMSDQVRSCSSTFTDGESTTTPPESLSCLGDRVRPGTHSYTWDMSSWGIDNNEGLLPVLSLRRKGTCWPCILIPVAAGTAAAIIFPRTGSNEVPTFVPPPRPTETQNR